MKAWYLDHSAVAVKTKNHLLLFDLFGEALCPKEGQGLAQGYLDPKEISNEDVLVFVSHEHHDHFDQKIFEWKNILPKVRYILLEEMEELYADGIFVHPHMEKKLDDCKITTLDSTDIGVAYLVEIDGRLIYHSGDLNWWYWEGEEESFNQDQEQRYKREMEYLSKALGDRQIDLAFVPVDPRQEQNRMKGLNCFLRNVSVNKVVPIHLWGDFTVCDDLSLLEGSCSLVMPKNRGELCLTAQP